MGYVQTEQVNQEFLLGNEAIARGAIEAGVGFVTGYPGTPSTEIIETLAKEADKYDFYVEWSTNEMVAFENAMGASIAGHRALITMKHAGFNWIADPLSIAALSGIRGGLVIVTADDPSCHSSANEQDSRAYSFLIKIPVLEPSDPQSAKDLIIEAFELSERTGLPVILRSVTRVGHSRSNVALGQIPSRPVLEPYVLEPNRFFITGATSLKRCQWLAEKQNELVQFSETFVHNEYKKQASADVCIITSGVAAAYVADVLDCHQDLKFSILKIATINPLPHSMVLKALADHSSILIVEEGGDVLETRVRVLSSQMSNIPRIYGRVSGHVPLVGELSQDLVDQAIRSITGLENKDSKHTWRESLIRQADSILPVRTMRFCAGCPHSGTMFALNKAMKKAKLSPSVCGDIGCYTLMSYPPHNLGGAKLSMGASIGLASGLSNATKQKTVAVIGDSTFIHAGIPGLINAVYNQSNVLIVLCDNETTGMTGGQPHAGTGVTAMGYPNAPIGLEKLIQGCGVKKLTVTDSYNVKETTSALKNGLLEEGVCVVITRRECALTAQRKPNKQQKISHYVVDNDVCVECGICVEKLGCPALSRLTKGVSIDMQQCTGCGVCAKVCPAKAIDPVENDRVG